MTNSKVGYVYLIDENLKVRWGGCADATLKEAQSLENCTGVLLKRLEDEKASAATVVKPEGPSHDSGTEGSRCHVTT